MKLFEECREREEEEEEEEGKTGRFARKGKQEGQGGKVVAGGGCWVSATASSLYFWADDGLLVCSLNRISVDELIY